MQSSSGAACAQCIQLLDEHRALTEQRSAEGQRDIQRLLTEARLAKEADERSRQDLRLLQGIYTRRVAQLSKDIDIRQIKIDQLKAALRRRRAGGGGGLSLHDHHSQGVLLNGLNGLNGLLLEDDDDNDNHDDHGQPAWNSHSSANHAPHELDITHDIPASSDEDSAEASRDDNLLEELDDLQPQLDHAVNVPLSDQHTRANRASDGEHLNLSSVQLNALGSDGTAHSNGASGSFPDTAVSPLVSLGMAEFASLQQYKAAWEELHAQHAELDDKHANLSAHYDSALAELKQVESQCATLKSVAESQKHVLSAKEDEYRKLEAQLQTTGRNIATYRGQIEQFRATAELGKQELSDARAEAAKLREELRGVRQNAEQRLNDQQAQFQKDAQNHAAKVQELQDAIRQQAAQLQQQPVHDADHALVQQQRQQLEQLQTQLQQRQTQIQRYEAQFQQQQAQMQQLQQQLQQQQAQIEQDGANLQQQASQMEEHYVTIQEQQTLIGDLQNQLNLYQGEREQQAKQHDIQIQQLQASLNDLHAQLRRHQVQEQELQATIQHQQSQLQEYRLERKNQWQHSNGPEDEQQQQQQQQQPGFATPAHHSKEASQWDASPVATPSDVLAKLDDDRRQLRDSIKKFKQANSPQAKAPKILTTQSRVADHSPRQLAFNQILKKMADPSKSLPSAEHSPLSSPTLRARAEQHRVVEDSNSASLSSRGLFDQPHLSLPSHQVVEYQVASPSGFV
ncbi:hypothetical protein CAOG_01391 [Capsaspora owczarzaki ATCC 30864]|uniref:Uncharacterized protein n=1 Tax=Capsaspora owczarzaki (strain ATCC 30864) TaxID=595528 RepID=A0A0D2X113_CAPO3|nr:hypothetical protein CAOG_01391 [Capsaspora owczarzaki ATCC 30864]KJE90009.1 hypothetical protein CAOG_001391 [Capsaspora owczarzaki ATCC 30864]|eukprot:XP_004349911.1 hypothetical protein CAOG_01391 [Capsaspora owczarzaki ATCC 30864]